MTDTAEVHSTRQLFFIVHAAVMPTSVFPAPHGRTMMPDLARLERVNGLVHNRKKVKNVDVS